MLGALDGIDAEGIAERLIGTFGSWREVIAAPVRAIERISGDERAAQLLAGVRRAMVWALLSEARDRPRVSCLNDLRPLLRATIGDEGSEHLLLFMLSGKNHLIRAELVSRGSQDETPVFVRDIVIRCLDAGASGLVIAHNHPSGNPEPSGADKDITRMISVGVHSVGLRLLDHVIVSRGGFYSFRGNGLV